MDPIGSIKLRWLHGALHDVTYELARSQFQFAPHTWEPAINAYRCENVHPDLCRSGRRRPVADRSDGRAAPGADSRHARTCPSRHTTKVARCDCWRWRSITARSNAKFCCRSKWRSTKRTPNNATDYFGFRFRSNNNVKRTTIPGRDRAGSQVREPARPSRPTSPTKRRRRGFRRNCRSCRCAASWFFRERLCR